jgi:tRNA modification GTPase
VLPPDDTIVAIATPPGRSAIGVVRLSGRRATAIAQALLGGVRLAPRRATYCQVALQGIAADDQGHDDAVAVWFPAPRSYTGEDVVEISLHGNPLLLEGVVRRATAEGARLARRGEFTLRSVVNGKRTLVAAEAVADVIDASTLAQARLAFDQLHGTLGARVARIDAPLFDLIAQLEASLDFPDEGYHFIADGEAARIVQRALGDIDALLADAARGRVIREGATVAVVGRPNVGKSSLFNALVGAERAIVTEAPGTTRDVLTERLDVGGLHVTLLDTAGIREAQDVAEREGVARSLRARATAEATLVVLDAQAGLTAADESLLKEAADAGRRIVVWNKCDLLPPGTTRLAAMDGVNVSALTGQGLDRLRARLAVALLGSGPRSEPPAVANIRHVELLERVRNVLRRARRLAQAAAPEEILLKELHDARRAFDDLVGVRTPDDVLAHVFERFCVGK